jgi:uncharacterized protein (TIGR01244 family)
MSEFGKRILVLAGLLAVASVNAQQAEIMNKADPLPGITSGGQPDEAALESLAEAGYVAVIDLRGENENRGFDEKSKVEALGMSYLALPVSGGADVSYENASELDRMLAEIDGPVLIHCGSSNRVGALLALRHKMNGASSEEALKLGEEAGLSSLRGAVETRLEER